jgi:predicted nucleic acid-binding protein
LTVSNRIVLDTGPLGEIAHARAKPEITTWLRERLAQGDMVYVPEIADYELRRELILQGLTNSLRKLDELKSSLNYLPINTDSMLMAAELWAQARKRGVPAADSKALDGDVILAAQAIQVGGVVATENVGHLSRFVEAKSWRDIR